MRSGRSTWLRVLALFGALAVSGPANAAWSGECQPDSREPGLFGIGAVVEQALAKTPPTLAQTIASKHLTRASTFVDVPWVAQKGSACGFYAAAMVLGKHENLSTDAATTRAEDLLGGAHRLGMTTDGYVTTANLAKLVKLNGYKTRVTAGATVDSLVASLDRGVPPIVLFVVDTDPKSPTYGSPLPTEPTDRNRGHFAVIEGVFTDDKGKRWIVAQHGWRSEPYVWSEKQFTKSWGLRGSHMLEIKRPLDRESAVAGRKR